MVKMELGLTATQIRLDTISHVRRPTDPPIRSTMCSQIRTRSVQLLSVVAEVRFVHVTLDLMCSDVRFVLIPNRRLNGLKCKRSNCSKIAELNCSGSICSEVSLWQSRKGISVGLLLRLAHHGSLLTRSVN